MRSRAELLALSKETQRMTALWRDANRAVEDCLTPQPPDEQKRDDDLLTGKLFEARMGGDPGPALLPPKFTPLERLVRDRGQKIADSSQVGRAAMWAREFLPIVAKYVT